MTVAAKGEALTLSSLRKVFRDPSGGAPVTAVEDVDLEIRPGELVTLLGPSGCGKTTLLRMIAGFEVPTSGEIRLGRARLDALPPNKREAAMVFQSYALFPHLSVRENVTFGLRMRHLSAGEIKRRGDAVLDLVGLGGLAERSPGQLSGGQQQRVALARAIVLEPSLLLFDEPLSNLDAKLREEMRLEIRELQQRVGITSVYVTHDQGEAMSISDRIAIMNAGRIEQLGTPVDLYREPRTEFVARFIGRANILAGEVPSPGQGDFWGVRLPIEGGAVGEKVQVAVRPEAIALHTEERPNSLAGTLDRTVFLGPTAEYHVSTPAGHVRVERFAPSAADLLQAGTPVWLLLPETPSRPLA